MLCEICVRWFSDPVSHRYDLGIGMRYGLEGEVRKNLQIKAKTQNQSVDFIGFIFY